MPLEGILTALIVALPLTIPALAAAYISLRADRRAEASARVAEAARLEAARLAAEIEAARLAAVAEAVRVAAVAAEATTLADAKLDHITTSTNSTLTTYITRIEMLEKMINRLLVGQDTLAVTVEKVANGTTLTPALAPPAPASEPGAALTEFAGDVSESLDGVGESLATIATKQDDLARRITPSPERKS